MSLQGLDFARSGLRIKLIEEELVSLGYGALKVLQERRLMFSTKEENQELDRYRKRSTGFPNAWRSCPVHLATFTSLFRASGQMAGCMQGKQDA